jgi:lipopolysaccharide transport system ATP-binding protein
MKIDKPIIIVADLSKKYLIGHQHVRKDGLRHSIENAIRRPFGWIQKGGIRRRARREEFWALKNISFEVKQGEILGIIGRNGAGKSTLLKIISRITEPTQGSIRIRGRVASLLEVGTGFHQELTGRENIFLNGAILGMTRTEIRRKFDEIVAFSEVTKFLDTPVKHYSSGMYVRLAFAVAAHLEPEIMIIDEVLAVGDAAFQKKCLGKMNDVAKQGRTVLFVSHNMAAITSLCTRCLLIDSGQLLLSGMPAVVVEQYLSRARTYASLPISERTDRRGNGLVRFTKVSTLNMRLEVIENVVSGQDIVISLEYDIPSSQRIDNTVIQIAFSGLSGQPLFACLSRTSHYGSLTLTPGARILCFIPRLPLLPGIYTFSVWCKVNETMEDWVAEAGKLSVAEGDFFGTGKLPPNVVGDFIVGHSWSVERELP